MADATYFKRKARRCRDLLKIAVLPDVREQLRIWVEEFETQAKSRAARRSRRRKSGERRRVVTAGPVGATGC